MKSFKLFLYFLLFAFLISLILSNESEMKEEERANVVVLNQHNFNTAINNNTYVFVKFYSPYCALSKKLEPEYIKAAQSLHKAGNPITLAEVESTANQNLIQKYKIDGYPTLKLFIVGIPHEYNGGRTESELVSWINKNTGFASKELKTVKEVTLNLL